MQSHCTHSQQNITTCKQLSCQPAYRNTQKAAAAKLTTAPIQLKVHSVVVVLIQLSSPQIPRTMRKDACKQVRNVNMHKTPLSLLGVVWLPNLTMVPTHNHRARSLRNARYCSTKVMLLISKCWCNDSCWQVAGQHSMLTAALNDQGRVCNKKVQ